MSTLAGRPQGPLDERGSTDPAPVDVRCPCGGMAQGTRRRRFQVQSCPHCGDALFVLPISPYPTPSRTVGKKPSPSRKRLPRRAARSTAGRTLAPRDPSSARARLDAALALPEKLRNADPIDRVGRHQPIDVERVEPAEPAAVASPPQVTKEPLARSVKSHKPKAAAPPAPKSVSEPVPRRAPRDARPLWKRPRVLLLVAALLVAATVAQSIWSSRRERMSLMLRQHTDEGTKAYEDGDFATAKNELASAVAIVNKLQWPARWLGRTNPSAEEFRAERRRRDQLPVTQLYKEAALCNDLLPTSIQDLAKQALEHTERNGVESWRRQFARRYQRGALILDTTVTPKSETGDGRFDVSYVVRVGEQTFHLDASNLDLLKQLQWNGPRRVVFGARVGSVEPADAHRRTWTIGLQADSGVLFTHLPTLRRFGWTIEHPAGDDNELAHVIETQRRESQQ